MNSTRSMFYISFLRFIFSFIEKLLPAFIRHIWVKLCHAQYAVQCGKAFYLKEGEEESAEEWMRVENLTAYT